MCLDPTTLAALALAAGGSAIQQHAQSTAIKKQQSATEAALLDQDAARQRNDNSIMKSAEQYNAVDREKALGVQQQAAADKLNASVVSNQLPQLQEGATLNGTVSGSYDAARGARVLDSLKKAAATARLMGSATGFNQLRLQEGQNNGNAAVEQGLNGALAKSTWEGAQPRIADAGMVNGNQMLLGSVLQAASLPIGMKLSALQLRRPVPVRCRAPGTRRPPRRAWATRPSCGAILASGSTSRLARA